MTVRELISKLSNYEMEDEVVIEDADTHWFLSLRSIYKSTRFIVLGGNYGDEVEK